MTRSDRMDSAGIAGGAFRNPSQVEFAVEHRESSMCLLTFTCICTRKTIQVQRYLGRRLSLSHNLRPDGISRNACPCNRTVGTGGGVRNGAVKFGRGGGSGLAVRGRARPRAVSCVSQGIQSGGSGDGTKGRKGSVEDTRDEGVRMAKGGARMAFCGQFSMCLYAVMCYRFPPPPSGALLPTYLMPHDIVTSIPSYAR